VQTPLGDVLRVATELSRSDKVGHWKVRWGIGRMRYTVRPGLYAVGNPDGRSPVLVSANYKLSFDRLRSELGGLDAWVLALDTRGINVWCAAGKGTMGTEELLGRMEAAGLSDLVTHRTVVVPQLGAPGISAHEVKKRSGFRVVFGPVRAGDIEDFLARGMRATVPMRTVGFPLRDRAALVPMELIPALKPALAAALGFLLLGGLGPGGYSIHGIVTHGAQGALLILGAFAAGAVLGPLLLPGLPGRAFSLKGFWLGLACVSALWAARVTEGLLPWVFLVPAVTSFVVMNFTGSTPFTSLSGVRREMRMAVPLEAIAGLVGVGLWIRMLFR
jgi:hypothetical protein